MSPRVWACGRKVHSDGMRLLGSAACITFFHEGINLSRLHSAYYALNLSSKMCRSDSAGTERIYSHYNAASDKIARTEWAYDRDALSQCLRYAKHF